MTHAILKTGEPDSKRKSCYDCIFNQAAVSWWCTNQEAINWRGSSFPTVHSCPFWSPCLKKSDLNWFERMFGDFVYIEN